MTTAEIRAMLREQHETAMCGRLAERRRDLGELITGELMGREKILAMQPGPELDNQIALKLFGVDPDELDDVNIFGGRRLPRYSQTWEGLGMVVVALKKMGKVVIIRADGLMRGDFEPSYTVYVDNGEGVRDDWAPAAASKAALLALEGGQ